MFDNLDDPKRQALLMMAAGLLSPVRGKGMSGFGESLSRGIQGGLLGFNEASQNKRRNALTDIQQKMAQMQLAEAERGQQFNRSAFTPGVGAQPLTPNDDEGNPMPSPEPRFNFAQAAAIDPMRAIQMRQMMTKQEAPMTLKPGEAAFDRSGKRLFDNPDAPKPPQLPSGMEMGPDGKPRYNEAYMKGQLELRAAGRAPATQVTTNVLPPREVFKDSMALKKDFDGTPEVKGFKEVQGAWDQISTALNKPSPANDLAAATKFMKLLDPGSVVRESELMMAMQASGAWDRFMNTTDRVLKGHKLTPEQRKDFYTAGEALYNASKDRYGQTVKQYEGIAQQYGLDGRFIEESKPRAIQKTIEPPKPGTIVDGYYFKGGDPSDRKNWVKRK